MLNGDTLKLDILLTAGFGASLYYFFKGLQVFREYRVLMDTPQTPIRSVAMGLVDIHGKATTDQPVTSPVTNTPCCFYKVDIERWITDKSGGNWIQIATDAEGPRFYLEDASGKVLVDAHHAEYDLLPSACVVTARDSSSPGERIVSKRKRASRGGREPLPPADLFSYAAGASARHSAWGGGVHGRFRLTEFLVVPDHWYDITGTCVENPKPQDERDRSMIAKGTHEPTFLITWRGEKEIRGTLRKRAAKHIFGGGAVAIVCLGLFLLIHGWLFGH